MATETETFIKNLQKSQLSAECPHCYDKFQLSEALLFDGRKKFPEKAEEVKSQWKKELDDRIAELVERQKSAKTKAEKSAVAVGIGKIIEKILPGHKNFTMVPSDWRFLAEPIDMIVFEGLSENKISHLTFLDIKTGDASLNKHQRRIRDAIQDHDVSWKVL